MLKPALSRLGATNRDPGRVVVALGWSSSDEGKLQRSFGVGRADFPVFVDLADVFQNLGYEGQVRLRIWWRICTRTQC